MLTRNEEAFVRTQVRSFVDTIYDKLTGHRDDQEPLDGDETEFIGKIVMNELDFIMGNLTYVEYSARRRQGDG